MNQPSPRIILSHIVLTLFWYNLIIIGLDAKSSDTGMGQLHWISLFSGIILASCHLYHQFMSIRKMFA